MTYLRGIFKKRDGSSSDTYGPLADWTCRNGHDNPYRSSRCWADCEGDIDDDGVTLHEGGEQ